MRFCKISYVFLFLCGFLCLHAANMYDAIYLRLIDDMNKGLKLDSLSEEVLEMLTMYLSHKKYSPLVSKQRSGLISSIENILNERPLFQLLNTEVGAMNDEKIKAEEHKKLCPTELCKDSIDEINLFIEDLCKLKQWYFMISRMESDLLWLELDMKKVRLHVSDSYTMFESVLEKMKNFKKRVPTPGIAYPKKIRAIVLSTIITEDQKALLEEQKITKETAFVPEYAGGWTETIMAQMKERWQVFQSNKMKRLNDFVDMVIQESNLASIEIHELHHIMNFIEEAQTFGFNYYSTLKQLIGQELRKRLY